MQAGQRSSSIGFVHRPVPGRTLPAMNNGGIQCQATSALQALQTSGLGDGVIFSWYGSCRSSGMIPHTIYLFLCNVFNVFASSRKRSVQRTNAFAIPNVGVRRNERLSVGLANVRWR